MIFRIYHEATMYVIEAPGGSRIVLEGGRSEELALFEEGPSGLPVERRLPRAVVIKAARRGYLGLSIRERRRPWMHPEVALARPAE
jgi:hypothetical protein